MQKPLALVCAQPCLLYYAWQVETMLYNFQSLNLHDSFTIHCVFAYNKNESDWEEKVSHIKKIEPRFKSVASFFYYEDTRKSPYSYISGVRPNVLKQHFKEHKYLSEYAVFYHDCDIVFTKYPDFLLKLTEDDHKWYVSDTISYIGYEYIVSKSEEVLDIMCEIVGVNKNVIRQKQNQAGGAQYLMKGVDWMFWDKVERDAELLFTKVTGLNNEIKKHLSEVFILNFKGKGAVKQMQDVASKEIVEEFNKGFDYKIKQVNVEIIDNKLFNASYHELQIWCADMWAVLWNAWLRGYDTEIIKELDFCWATDNYQKWDERYIYHNAGATANLQTRIFYKSAYQKSVPYLLQNTFDTSYASYRYFDIIKQAGQSSMLLQEPIPVKVIHVEVKGTDYKKPKEGLLAKAKEIAIAYATALNPTDEQKAVAEIRLETCMTSGENGGYCEELNENSVGLLYCKKCGCATKGKIYSPKGADACPLGKWTI